MRRYKWILFQTNFRLKHNKHLTSFNHDTNQLNFSQRKQYYFYLSKGIFDYYIYIEVFLKTDVHN